MNEPFAPDPAQLPTLTDIVLPTGDRDLDEKANYAAFYVAFFSNELRRERLLRDHNMHVTRRIAAPRENEWRVKYYFPPVGDNPSAEVVLSAMTALVDRDVVTAQFRKVAGHFQQKQDLKTAVQAISATLSPDQINALLALKAEELKGLLKK